MKLNIHKILIINPGGIGDLIIFTPALQILKNNFPEAKTDVFTSFTPVSSQVVQGGRLVNGVIDFDWNKNNFFEKIKFIYKLRKEKYDLSVIPSGPNPLKWGIFSYLIGAKLRLGEYKKLKTLLYTHQAKADSNLHKVYSSINLLRILGLKIDKIPWPIFELKEKDREFAQEIILQIGAKNKILIGFHPGAGEKMQFKVWSKDNFIKLGREILENYDDTYLILFGGPKEKEACREIKEKIGEKVFLATNFNLKQIAALIDNCRIFVSSDSGLSHIASTTKADLITIFGPTIPERTGPFGERVHIIKEKCSYQSNDSFTPKYDTKRIHKCLEKITPERVFNELEKFIFLV
jgi:heptosyltransferase-2